ncbi:esterase family protein [Nocardia sp. NBC_01503]|uniref:alpha/beta hydrolase n=1 Tax=Nocardia sp. NBC_01503 TaxID=2975997 RepID=UPI002E7B5859|nr:alpha/beta hydrolase-fold protein [Nocardia sp. NBC_01503]WTL32727.1 esterase family protein [Nocardia sp. NBC_01503]
MGQGYRAAARSLSRRSLLATTGLLGLAAAGAAVSAGVNAAPDGDSLQRAVGGGPRAVLGIEPIVRTDRVYSAARGREVEVITILPPGVPTQNLPMSLLLHGLHGTARTAAIGGIGGVLAAAVAARLVPAFGFMAVDGGDNYWHQHFSGDDPMTMLLDEAPNWLAARGLATEPFACTGTSMGGFGALVYGRRRAERGRPTNAIATLSPGLITSWNEMSKRNAFASVDEWAALDPLQNISKLGPAPTGVWVGDRDRFVDGCREFMRRARLEVALVTPGAHNDDYWSTVTPDVVRFLGSHVR